MAEKKIVVDDLRLHYSGLLDLPALYKLINDVILERGYVKHQKRNEDYVRPDGREIHLELRPTKEFEHEFWGMIKMRLHMKDVQEVIVDMGHTRRRLSKGDLVIIFDGWTTTNLEHAWETHPTFVFLRTLFDIWVSKVYFGKHEGEISADIKYLYRRIMSLLNLYRYTDAKHPESETKHIGNVPA